MTDAMTHDAKNKLESMTGLPEVELPGQYVTFSTLQTVVMRYVVAGQLAPGRRILELGCGPGIGLEYLRECDASNVVGADRNVRLLRLARERSSTEVVLVQCDATRMPFRDASLDAVLLLEVLMYLTDPVAVLREARRILGDHGVVLITMPNATALGVRPSGAIERFYSGREVEGLLSESGFVPEVFGAFPLQEGARARTSRLRMASRVLDSMERCGLPRELRTRLTSTVLRKNHELPTRIDSVHRSLLPEGDEGRMALLGDPNECRVLYARGVAVQR